MAKDLHAASSYRGTVRDKPNMSIASILVAGGDAVSTSGKSGAESSIPCTCAELLEAVSAVGGKEVAGGVAPSQDWPPDRSTVLPEGFTRLAANTSADAVGVFNEGAVRVDVKGAVGSCLELLEEVSAADAEETAGGVATTEALLRDCSNAFLKDAARLAPKRSAVLAAAGNRNEGDLVVGCAAVSCVQLLDDLITGDTTTLH